MMFLENRKPQEFEDDIKKWKIWFDIMPDNARSDISVVVKFTLNREDPRYLNLNDLEELKKDLEDLGKFRIIKQGRDFLRNDG